MIHMIHMKHTHKMVGHIFGTIAAWPDMATELQRVKNPRGNWKVCAPSSELETLETKHAQHLNQIAGHPMRRENQKSLKNMKFFECLQQLIYLASGKCRRVCTSAHPRSYKILQNEPKSSQKAWEWVHFLSSKIIERVIDHDLAVSRKTILLAKF